MTLETTTIQDLVIINPAVFNDERGYFFEAYNKEKFCALGITIDFVQDNQSFSKKGTLRGLHYQNPPHAQTKLVRVLQGEIIDVAVDLRKDSATFGHSFSIKLTAENKKQLLVPQGFAHGFSVISETAVVLYKCDQYYNKASEGGIRFDDAQLNIDWGMDLKEAIVSEKDLVLPGFNSCNSEF
ncbi:MAG TPA: dTDP-4-dehydrorhamnose 3,5-epimerase [Flavobacterium sp.]|jgi:dTDP-4-dehydrorhamnose 3,5-epimerase|uniref:dTDP-4-dehydrorhamnose 3,5-epimerase n=1 Tax=Flavobacterium sp. TaxID=239 RepID=UPI001B515CD3|nr:dTDP-4-dehydrorhamnose 3,5-epimerase [Flavobacterium sp.]MBP6146723.1 dTDP-4-dehydrorhamnose 3,5-epimerase [Flavobacterium sp.]MBP7183569.1 dTDP-4-dehydrorhamnose 3,5-epimerase [Flavobacterium sp.]MBP8888172.1 dTDP-4-dehydrorhamnose 3,5-epimerase [Flavobacterium sp.]HRL72210.1 dTDP-4-dehydrorhamnose 3,5-epimerase [Flavobacterium sp.]HRM47109.1 dTDP-4-dehydrorhamnose 3,5-epimerase [Flavobacterium sp.]